MTAIRYLGPCGFAFPRNQAYCEACSRPIRCVYLVEDEGWTFLMGRRCYQRLQAFLGAAA
jgi:hypothetical protein